MFQDKYHRTCTDDHCNFMLPKKICKEQQEKGLLQDSIDEVDMDEYEPDKLLYHPGHPDNYGDR